MIRNYHLDNTKFVLIFFVILGHSLARLGGTPVCRAVDASVYFFHMPLMIFVSGYFSKKTDKKHFHQSIVRLLEPLLIFNVIHIVIRYLMDEPLRWDLVLLVPNWSLWYLLSLIFWRISIEYVFAKITPPRLILLSIAVGLVAGFVTVGHPLSFQRTCSLLPFFVAGYCVGRNRMLTQVYNRMPPIIAILLLAALPFCTYYINFPFKIMLEGVEPYHKFGYPLWLTAFYRMALYIISGVASICVLRLVPQRKIVWISDQGKNTLLYYLYHTLIIYGLISINRHFLILPKTFIPVMGYALFNIVLIWALIQINFFRIIPHLISRYFLNKIGKDI